MVAAAAQGAVITQISQDSLTLGDPLEMTISVLAARDAQITPPSTDTGFGAFTIIDWGVDRYPLNEGDSIVFRYKLTTFSPDGDTIPAQIFLWARDSVTTDTLLSAPLPMRLISVIDTDSATIRPLKAPQRVGKPSLLWIWMVLGGAAVLTALVLLLRRLGKKERAPLIEPPKPPYEEALLALRELDHKRYLDKGMFQEQVFELSDILKRYVARRFEVSAEEFTTHEMVQWIASSTLLNQDRESLRWFFVTADPVKFAKLIPERQEVEKLGAEVWKFLEATRPSAQLLSTPAQEAPAHGA
jgi:hypothetical protein